MIQIYPELFPAEIANVYKMKDINVSKKLQTTICRIDIAGTAYTIMLSYLMPYMIGITYIIEKALLLRKFGVPKENRPNPIVQDSDGIPLALSINNGNTNEQITLNPLEEKILSDYDLSKFVVCNAAGLCEIIGT